jgi:Fe-S cluster biogenesis protein NfuA
MNEIRVRTQTTPNPNAVKFILNRDVIATGKISFTDPQSASHVPLARALLEMTHVVQVHFYENTLTVTQDGEATWVTLSPLVIETIKDRMTDHDPFFETLTDARPELSPELQEIDDILARTVRPALQMDGGDLIVTGKEGRYVTIAYQGACGGCPSSTSGTLNAIESVLRQEYDPDVIVVIDESVDAYSW